MAIDGISYGRWPKYTGKKGFPMVGGRNKKREDSQGSVAKMNRIDRISEDLSPKHGGEGLPGAWGEGLEQKPPNMTIYI